MADAYAPRHAVLLVEDNPVQLMEAAAARREAGYEIAEAATIEAAQAHLAARPELVALVADVDLAGQPLSSFTLAKAVAARWHEVAILIVSGVEWPLKRAWRFRPGMARAWPQRAAQGLSWACRLPDSTPAVRPALGSLRAKYSSRLMRRMMPT